MTDSGYGRGDSSSETRPPEVDQDDQDDRDYAVEDGGAGGRVLDDYPREGGRRRKKRLRSVPGCLAALVALAILFGGLYVVATKGVELLQDKLASPGDFAGPPRGKVVFEVETGDTIAQMGRGLKAKGVVKSVDAFTGAALDEPKSTGIQVGFYQLQKEMPAADALAVLVDPANLVRNTVTIPEGLRVTDILDVLADKTDFDRAAFEKVLQDPASIGLPGYAAGNPEGYLFPSTYDFGPKDGPKAILTTMVSRWSQSAGDLGLEEKAAALGYTPAEVMTIASLVEAEAKLDPDYGKVSRVIYNRLDIPNGSDTNGLLQIDASVNYGLQQDLGVALTTEQLQQDTPYNTYTRAGLPPTPIEAPGDKAIEAALNPTPGDWYFYVTVDLATAKTKFAETYDEFLTYKAELDEYCTTSDAC
ncbi:MAG: endolytic transglycosylase MltG [Nocardioides sp.]